MANHANARAADPGAAELCSDEQISTAENSLSASPAQLQLPFAWGVICHRCRNPDGAGARQLRWIGDGMGGADLLCRDCAHAAYRDRRR